MATGSRALFGREVGWLDRSLVLACAAGLAITVLAGLLQVRFGSHPVTFRQVVAAVFDPLVWLRPNVLASFLPGDGLTGALGFERSFDLPTETLIVWSVRLPRVLVAALVGLNLARSGAVFQAVTRNGLAGRFTLGVPPGAGLAVLLTLIVFVNVAALLPLTAALGGRPPSSSSTPSPGRGDLAGVIVGTVLNSLQTALFLFASNLGTVQAAIARTTGSLTGVDWQQVRAVLPPTLLVLPGAVLGARESERPPPRRSARAIAAPSRSGRPALGRTARCDPALPRVARASVTRSRPSRLPTPGASAR